MAAAALREGRLIDSGIDLVAWDRLDWDGRTVDVARSGKAATYTTAAGPAVIEVVIAAGDQTADDAVVRPLLASLPADGSVPSPAPVLPDLATLTAFARDRDLTIAGAASTDVEPRLLSLAELAPTDAGSRTIARSLGLDAADVTGITARGSAGELYAILDPDGDGSRWVEPFAASIEEMGGVIPVPTTLAGRQAFVSTSGTSGQAVFASGPWAYVISLADGTALPAFVEGLP